MSLPHRRAETKTPIPACDTNPCTVSRLCYVAFQDEVTDWDIVEAPGFGSGVDGVSLNSESRDLEPGCCCPDSVDLAGHGVVGVAASGSVLGRCSVAQGRMPVPVVVLVFKVADDHSGLEQGVPVVAVEAFLA